MCKSKENKQSIEWVGLDLRETLGGCSKRKETKTKFENDNRLSSFHPQRWTLDSYLFKKKH